MFKYAALALALMLVSPTLALSQPRSAQEINAKVNAEMSALGARLKSSELLENQSVDLMVKVMGQMDVVSKMADRRASPAQVRAWAQTWEPGLRSEIAAIRAKASALPPLDFADYPSLAAAGAQSGIDLKGLAAVANSRKTSILDITKMIEEIAESEKKAATGDYAAMKRLGSSTLISMTTLLTKENNNLEAGIATLPASNPNHDYAQVILESNATMIVLLRAAIDTVDDRKIDARATVAAMRQHIKAGLAATALMRAHTEDAVRVAKGGPGAETEVGRKTIAVANTFNASADVEVKLFAYMEDMARKLEAGAAPLDLFPDDSPFDKLVDERTKLQLDRASILAR